MGTSTFQAKAIIWSDLRAFWGRLADQQDELAVCVPGQAVFGCRTPVLEREGAGHWDLEPAAGGKLGVLVENVVALCAA